MIMLKKFFKTPGSITWVPALLYMEGPWDEATKTVTLRGKMIDPMTGKEVTVRETFKIIDDDTQLMTMYDTRAGKEMKSMEIKFTRRK